MGMGVIPPISSLRAFEAAARHGSFTRAAAELNVTQAAISYRVKVLEQRVGVALFDRKNRSIVLTPAGKSYLIAIREALERLEQATERAILLHRKKHTLRVFVMQAFASLWLVPRLERFHERAKDVEVSVVCRIGGSGPQFGPGDFDRHGIDAAILLTHQIAEDDGLVREKLAGDCAVAVCSPTLPENGRPLERPSDLRHHTILHAHSWPEAWEQWFGATKAARVKPNREIWLQHTGLTVQTAVSGLGVAIAHLALVTDDLRQRRLICPIHISVNLERGYFFVCKRQRAEAPEVVEFKEWIRTEMTGSVGPDPVTGAACLRP